MKCYESGCDQDAGRVWCARHLERFKAWMRTQILPVGQKYVTFELLDGSTYRVNLLGEEI